MVQDLQVALRVRASLGQAVAEVKNLRLGIAGTGRATRAATPRVRQLSNAWSAAAVSMGRARQSLFSIRGLIAGLGLALVVRQVTRAMIRQEDAIAQVERGLRNLGPSTTLTSQGLQDIAAGLQDVTTFGDEAVLELQSLLLTFRRIDPSVFERTTEAALDMAVVLRQGPRDAALQLAKALEDPIQGLTALRRSGTVFSEAQTAVIRRLVETNRLAEAQGLILDEVERQYGGAARAARETLGGALSALSNAFGDLLEGAGDTDRLRDAIEDLVTLLQDPGTVAAANALAAALVDGFTEAIRLARELADLIRGDVTLDNAGLPVTPEQEAVLAQIRELADTDPIAAHRILGDLEDRLLIAAGRAEELRHQIAEVGTARVGGIAVAAALQDNLRIVEETITRLRATIAAGEEVLAAPPQTRPAGVGVPDEGPAGPTDDDIREQEQRVARQTRAIEQIHRAAAQLAGPFRTALHQALEWRFATLEGLGEITEETEAYAAEVERIYRERVRRAWEEELDRRSAAHREAVAEIEGQEAALDIGDAYERAVRDATRWRDATLAALDETAEGYDELAARVHVAFAAMTREARQAGVEQAEALGGSREGIEAAFDAYAMSAGDSFARARDAAERAMKGAEDAVVRFAQTGKASVSDLADAIIADLIRIQLQQNITGPLAGAIPGLIASVFGGGVSPVNPPAGPRRFHKGVHLGPGGRPIPLSSDEVPAILQTGETVLPRGAGMGGGQRLTVVLRNESSTPLEAIDDGQRIDGEEIVTEILVRDARRNGPVTQTLRSAISGGV